MTEVISVAVPYQLINLSSSSKPGRKGTFKNPGSQTKQAFNTGLTSQKGIFTVVLEK